MWKKINGKTSETIEEFYLPNGRIEFFTIEESKKAYVNIVDSTQEKIGNYPGLEKISNI